jgi:hypothetical protein
MDRFHTINFDVLEYRPAGVTADGRRHGAFLFIPADGPGSVDRVVGLEADEVRALGAWLTAIADRDATCD